MTCCDKLITSPKEKMGTTVRIGLLLLLLFSVQAFGHAKPVQNPSPTPASQEESSDSTWRLLSTICSQIMEHHLSPPTRQQLYLSGVKALYVANRATPPSELGEQFSKMTSEQDFEKAVVAAWNEISTLPNFDAAQTSRAAATGMALNATIYSRFTPRNDSFTRFVSAKDYRVQQQLEENQYVGIGIVLMYESGLPQIRESHFGGPAQKAGAGENDWILQIDGWQTRDQPFQEIIDRLRGPKGSRVVIVVQNKDSADNETRTYEMIRNVIPLTTVKGNKRRNDGSWDFSVSGFKNVAMLKFDSIVGSTAAELSELARQIDHESFQSVILDFRDINSADLHDVTMLADVLLGDVKLGEIVGRYSTSTIRLRPDLQLRDKRLVVLADQFVSGELFLLLAALKENRDARFAGTITRSDAACVKSIELAEGMGAIDNLVYATCVPTAKSSPTDGVELFGEELFFNSPLSLRADVSVNGTLEELMNAAIKAAGPEPNEVPPTVHSKGNRP